ncbi:MAG: YfcE family phosphodiesterase [Dehalococcoidales bacterium]|nr:YfcE family phosphodiesterase [Dehalococcoidales bacterium]
MYYITLIIGLLSDTHICEVARSASISTLSAPVLPIQKIKDVFCGVDLIMHAGDIYTIPTLDELEQIAPVLAAEGDDDPVDVCRDRRVKRKHIITVEGVTIGLAHQYAIWYWNKPEKPLDVIVYGHTHQSDLQTFQGILQINPGSPTFPHYKFQPGTVGLLTVNSGKAEAKIIQLE